MKMILRWNAIGILALVLVCGLSGAASASEYVFRDLMGNTLPANRCKAQTEAESVAVDAYNIDKHAKIFCESQGYGWHVSEKKDTGKLVCEECSGVDKGKYQCHVEDVVVSCKRLKPGSVGLFPGKG
ncbi:hypothetical protein ACW73L_15325 [Methylolobus aquaticus]